MEISDDTQGVVIDAGSQNVKAGFAGEASPRIMFPATVGRFRRAGFVDGIPDIYCGHEAIRNRGISDLAWPVQDGLIKDWNEMELLWHHTFYKGLHQAPESTMVLHAVHPMMPLEDKERMTEIMFESFAIKGLYMAKSPNLVLYASGRTSGIVWESGYASSYVAPVFEGFHLKNSTVLYHINGKVLTKRLQKLLSDLGYSFNTAVEFDIMNQIKKDLCYVASDYEKELAISAGSDGTKIQYTLPDGQHIILGKERFQVPELMLQPSLGQFQCKSLVESINGSIDACCLDYRNIVFSGGSTLFPGLVERVKNDMTHQAKPGFKPSIEAMALRQYAAWAGGSIMASMKNLMGFWMTKQEYADSGVDRVKYKLF